MGMIDVGGTPAAIWEAVLRVADAKDADILLLNTEMRRPACSALIEKCIYRNRAGEQRENVILIPVTRGGDADVAYRISRCLQRKYKRVSAYISGSCKSAGTLVALGAHELVFSDHGELGPLDVQLRKENKLFESQSGLNFNASLSDIQDRARMAFRDYFMEIETGTGGAVSVDSAGKMAARLTTGLFAPLIAQLDPLHLGEATRAIGIAHRYGMMLIAESGNASQDGLEHLISGYPSHSFVIDRTEARLIFENIREPDDDELCIAVGLGHLSRAPRDARDNEFFEFVNDTANQVTNTTDTDQHDNRDVNDETQDGSIESDHEVEQRNGAPTDAEAGGDVSPSEHDEDVAATPKLKGV